MRPHPLFLSLLLACGEPPVCEDPEENFYEGDPTGLATCADGRVVHVGSPAFNLQQMACEGEAAAEGCPGGCAQGTLCFVTETDLPTFGCSCQPACSTDADCDAGELCTQSYEGALPRCVAASCSADADCDDGLCTWTSWFEGCADHVAIQCSDRRDRCDSDADCDAGENCGIHPGTGARGCVPLGTCGDGRPLRVDGAPRLAPTIAAAGWSAELRPEPGPADRWLAQAQAEHASVAAFARFMLQLQALGAPAELLAATVAAMGDEVEHARLAWGMASALAGHPLGAGPLAVHDVSLETDPERVLAEVVLEGCIQETLGAAEAAEAGRRASDPVAAGVHARIAEDETRHAALAWRTAAWMLRRWPRLGATFDHLVRSAVPAEDDRAGHPAHGWLDGATRAEVQRDTLHRVVRPMAARLRRVTTTSPGALETPAPRAATPDAAGIGVS